VELPHKCCAELHLTFVYIFVSRQTILIVAFVEVFGRVPVQVVGLAVLIFRHESNDGKAKEIMKLSNTVWPLEIIFVIRKAGCVLSALESLETWAIFALSVLSLLVFGHLTILFKVTIDGI
jgi:hypothetical protein